MISKIAFLLLSLGIGAYSETCAVAAVATAVLFSAQAFFVRKRKPSKLMIASFVLVLVGLSFLVSAPAEGIKLTSSFGAKHLLINIQTMLYYCKSFWPLIAVTDILFVVAVSVKADKDTLFTAATILLIALSIMASLTVAVYVPERVLTTPVILLVAVCAMLVVELFDKNALLSIALQTLPIFMSFYFIVCGVNDIIQTDSHIETSEQIISSYANSEETLYVQRFHSKTKYSPFYELNYANDEPSTRHNVSMCRYYGVSKIIGVDK